MVERHTPGPLPRAYPVAHGAPPVPDGQTVHGERPPLPLATREVIYGWICAGIVIVAPILAAILR